MSAPAAIRFIAVYITAILFPCTAQIVEMTGYVSDLNGKPVPGAKVQIKDANQSAFTGIDGTYKLEALVPVVFSRDKTARPPAPFLKSDGLHFSVNKTTESVEIDLFTLAGKKAAAIMHAQMDAGIYRIDPINFHITPQVFVLRVRIGDRAYCCKLPLMDCRRQGSFSVKKLSGEFTPVPHPKKSVVIDSLIVTAEGFLRSARQLDSYLGSHYVVLKTAVQSTKKLLKFFCDFNQGTTDDDPMVSLCTAIWAQDMGRDYVTTLFVTQWLSEEGYRYPNFSICPDWKGQDSLRWALIRNSDSTFVDAVTKATPITGSASFDFNPLIFGLQTDFTYRFCIEVNIEGNYHILFTDSLTLGSQTLIRTPAPLYVPARHPSATVDGISGLRMRYE
jgi:hypothetical protein